MKENFNINNNHREDVPDMEKLHNIDKEALKRGELSMTVSQICYNEKGERYAFVTFTDGVRNAEGKIPDCTIISNQGFAKIEITQLESYMKENLSMLKKMASHIKAFDIF